jgi:hypothetical protein
MQRKRGKGQDYNENKYGMRGIIKIKTIIKIYNNIRNKQEEQNDSKGKKQRKIKANEYKGTVGPRFNGLRI